MFESLQSKPKDIVQYPITSEPHEVETMFLKGLARIQKKDQTGEDNSYNNDYLRVSNLTGGCLREKYYYFQSQFEKQELKQQYVVKNAQNELRTTLGNKLHDLIQEVLKDDLTHVEERVYDHENKVTGKNDGVIFGDSIFEIKTVGLYVFNDIIRKNKPKENHVKQVHWYMKMFGLRKTVILYVNRNIDMYFGTFQKSDYMFLMSEKTKWLSEGFPECIKVFEIDFDDDIMDEQVALVQNFWERVEKIKTRLKDGKTVLKPPPKVARFMCDSCQYLKHCRNE